jgi:hypothetical protein
MDHYLAIVRGLTLLVALASIFAISVVTILKVIKRAEFFSGRSSALVAVSLAVLLLVALSHFLVGPADAYHAAGSDIAVEMANHSLLPGVALGVVGAVLLSQILLLASRIRPNEESEPLAKEPELAIKPKSPGRPKKKPVEKESKETTKPVGSAS